MHTVRALLIAATLAATACSYASDRPQESVTMEPSTKTGSSMGVADASPPMDSGQPSSTMMAASATPMPTPMPMDAGPSMMVADGGASALDGGAARNAGAPKDAGAPKKK